MEPGAMPKDAGVLSCWTTAWMAGSLFFYFYFTEIEFCYVPQAGLELTMYLRLASTGNNLTVAIHPSVWGCGHAPALLVLCVVPAWWELPPQLPSPAPQGRLRRERSESVALSAIPIPQTRQAFVLHCYNVSIWTPFKSGSQVLPLLSNSFNLLSITEKKALWKMSLLTQT